MCVCMTDKVCLPLSLMCDREALLCVSVVTVFTIGVTCSVVDNYRESSPRG